MNITQPTIVFDWNCTLLDDMPLVVESHNAMHKAFGKDPVTTETYQQNFVMPTHNFYRFLGFSDEVIKRDFLTIQNIFHDYYEAHVDTQSLRHYAHELLDNTQRHGMNRIILSNHLEQPIKAQLSRLNIGHHFDHVLAYADRATQFKHETKGQRLARFIAEHKMDPANCVIIGDTAEEIHIARELGMIGVAITGGFYSTERLEAERPDHLVHGLDEFHAVLRQRGWVS